MTLTVLAVAGAETTAAIRQETISAGIILDGKFTIARIILRT
jgi:hypothetical protein